MIVLQIVKFPFASLIMHAGPISEEFLVCLTTKGMPRDLRLLGNIRTVFKDIPKRHFAEKDLYLVCYIYRKGPFDAKVGLAGANGIFSRGSESLGEPKDGEEEVNKLLGIFRSLILHECKISQSNNQNFRVFL